MGLNGKDPRFRALDRAEQCAASASAGSRVDGGREKFNGEILRYLNRLSAFAGCWHDMPEHLHDEGQSTEGKP